MAPIIFHHKSIPWNSMCDKNKIKISKTEKSIFVRSHWLLKGIVLFACSDWLLKLGISCTIHWFAKHNGRARVITFPAEFWPDKIHFFFAGYSLVWYILTQLFTCVGEQRWIIVKYFMPQSKTWRLRILDTGGLLNYVNRWMLRFTVQYCWIQKTWILYLVLRTLRDVFNQ